MICFGGNEMFYDERIERIKGRISRNAILMSFVISFVLGGAHLANIIRNASDSKYYWFVMLEISICVGTLIAMIIGAVLNTSTEKDERAEVQGEAFYNKAASLLVRFVLGAFAFVMPIALYIGKPLHFADQGFGGIIYTLFFIVGIYVIYSFRRNDVYFNYSIMDSDCYDKGVLKNIGKLSLYALGFLGISAMSFIGLVAIKSPDFARVVEIILDMVAYYIGTLIEIILLYLLYSFLEKCSYNSESSISNSPVISLGMTIFIYAVYTAGVIFIDSTAISQTAAVQLASIISTLDIYIKFALLIFLTYFGYEYQRIRKSKLLLAACITILLSEALSVFIGRIFGGLIFVFMPEIMSQDAYIINKILSGVSVAIEDLSGIVDLVGFVLILFALVKDKLIHKAHRFAGGAFAVLVGVELFLRTQVDLLCVNIYHFIAEMIVLCYFAVIVAFVAKREKRKLL